LSDDIFNDDEYEHISVHPTPIMLHIPTRTIVAFWTGYPINEVINITTFIKNKNSKEMSLIIIDDYEGEYISKILYCSPAIMMFPYFVDNFKEVTLITSSYYPENQLAALKKHLPCIRKMKSGGSLKYNMLIKARIADDEIKKKQDRLGILVTDSNRYKKHFVSMNGVPRLYRAYLIDNILSSDIKDTLYYTWVLRNHEENSNVLHGNLFKTFDPNKRVLLDLDQNNIEARYDDVPNEYNYAVIDLFVETSCDAEYTNDVFITEKTWKPFIKEKVFLGFNGPHYYKTLADDGFRLYHNLFDYSFDSIIDTKERFNKYMENIYRIGRLPLDEVIKLAESHNEDIKYNRVIAMRKQDAIPNILKPHVNKIKYRLFSLSENVIKEEKRLGHLYHKTGTDKWTTYLNDTQAIVEIGSDNWEGSTEFYAELANKYNIPFHTVDLNSDIGPRLKEKHDIEYWRNTTFHLAEGSEWTNAYNGPKIHTLYLDNFDWDWKSTDDENQKYYNDVLVPKYEQAGFELNNINSAATHLKQMINLLPHMADDCVVCVDDTYQSESDLYIGKGAGVVLYLIALGFIVVENANFGVLLVRGKYKDLFNQVI
jgi:hypothetical protein